ncbi:sugar ABC transporter substrate-binding protein [Paenibacillus polymyxa]|uniref:sugar ABC transporter substrate-binding protein n=1 Tax=Paenibacillus polymyxa TaxID=1406 RepID=UPI0025B63DE6|nr:sugar ABC transporter substrate-binding protein [Paenibacillus polymyxa]MDN4079971.1 sugar ABC transporter substrate-binding protein [Paenibacillus polymyxa]MDN4105207.1 sugar ABC transporter substrate-binding protein [Paenibacillus polymyxa]MDN4115293.1 sugar ABC transporter substrate-binding protein [Paenibacillus polymyxa]
MMKRTLGIILASTLLLGGALVGCSSKDDSSGKDANGKTTITMWGMGAEGKLLPEIVKDFEKENPEIHVDVQALPWDNAHDKLLTAVASKSGPDVVQLGTSWVPELASAGALTDITPYISKYPELEAKNFFKGAVSTAQFEAKPVAVPWYTETRVLFYRSDLLKQVGYNEAPKTWEELSDAAQKLAARGKGKYGISFSAKEQSMGFMFALQNGSKLVDEQGNPLFNQAPFVDAVKYVNTFFQNGSNAVDIGIDSVQGLQGEGIVPMFISGPFMIKEIKSKAPELEGKWNIAELPGKVNNLSVLGGANLSIMKFSKHPEESAKFLAYMSKPETQLKWMELSSNLPATTKSWEDAKLKSDPMLLTIRKQLDHSAALPQLAAWEEVSQQFIKSFERIYRGHADVQKEMDDFNQQAASIMKK